MFESDKDNTPYYRVKPVNAHSVSHSPSMHGFQRFLRTLLSTISRCANTGQAHRKSDVTTVARVRIRSELAGAHKQKARPNIETEQEIDIDVDSFRFSATWETERRGKGGGRKAGCPLRRTVFSTRTISLNSTWPARDRSDTGSRGDLNHATGTTSRLQLHRITRGNSSPKMSRRDKFREYHRRSHHQARRE